MPATESLQLPLTADADTLLAWRVSRKSTTCVLFCNFGETTRPYGFLSQIIQSETLISIIWFWCVMASKAFKPCMFRCSHTILSVWGGLIRSEGDVQEAIPILFTRLFLRFNFHDHDDTMYLLLCTCIILFKLSFLCVLHNMTFWKCHFMLFLNLFKCVQDNPSTDS